MRIYHLSNDTLVSSIVASNFQNQGHEIQLFDNSIKFYESVIEKKPDAVIIDLLISYITGYDLINKIRMINDKYIKIIVLSKVNVSSVIEEAFNLGIDDYLTTPFNVKELVARVNRLEKYHKIISKSDTLSLSETSRFQLNIV